MKTSNQQFTPKEATNDLKESTKFKIFKSFKQTNKEDKDLRGSKNILLPVVKNNQRIDEGTVSNNPANVNLINKEKNLSSKIIDFAQSKIVSNIRTSRYEDFETQIKEKNSFVLNKFLNTKKAGSPAFPAKKSLNSTIKQSILKSITIEPSYTVSLFIYLA